MNAANEQKLEAARVMLAALVKIRDAIDSQETVQAPFGNRNVVVRPGLRVSIGAAIAQAEAAGIKAEGK